MRKISIGAQGFEFLRQNNAFYVDKTDFIKEWWGNTDVVTLITRPRRFGKTLNLDTLNCFFSNRYANRGDLFEGLDIWKDPAYRQLQGTYPVIFLSFSTVKYPDFKNARNAIIDVLIDVFTAYKRLWRDDPEEEKQLYSFMDITYNAADSEIAVSLKRLSAYLNYRYRKKVLILLDEYDTPLQEAYVNHYWNQMSDFIRGLFNATFKENQALERALLTGITRVSKESIFSGLNNPKVVSIMSNRYATSFGFTEEEVLAALKEYGLYDQREKVKAWYDGFSFGNRSDIYNPWSITNYLDTGKFGTYWANSSDNGLVSYLIRTGSPDIKMTMEKLMEGECIETPVDEEIVFNDLDRGPDAVWSLLLATGYLRLVSVRESDDDFDDDPVYTLKLTNGEVRRMFNGMIRGWFAPAGSANDAFIQAMIRGDTKAMNAWMNDIALMTISSFDSGKKPSVSSQPERFYHGFVLGLLVQERKDYLVRSNRESGLGRYDICLFPRRKELPGIVIEFKVQDEKSGETTLRKTAESALAQIRDRHYVTDLRDAGITAIHAYGFAFSGKEILILKEGEQTAVPD